MIYYKKFDSSLYQSKDFKSRFSKLFVSNSETEVSKVILICKFISNLIALLISQTLFAYLPTLYQKFSINFIVIHKNYTIIHHELLWCHYKYPLLKEKNNFPYTSCPIFIMKKKKGGKRSGWKNRISDHQPTTKQTPIDFQRKIYIIFWGSILSYVAHKHRCALPSALFDEKGWHRNMKFMRRTLDGARVPISLVVRPHKIFI